MQPLRTSMYMAFLGGIGMPVLETIRRCHQLSDLHYFFFWFDDYLMGGFLVFAAWKTLRTPTLGRPYLCAAWGMATGMLFLSFVGQLQSLDLDDPAPVSSTAVAVIKGVLLLFCIISMGLALKKVD